MGLSYITPIRIEKKKLAALAYCSENIILMQFKLVWKVKEHFCRDLRRSFSWLGKGEKHRLRIQKRLCICKSCVICHHEIDLGIKKQTWRADHHAQDNWLINSTTRFPEYYQS